MSININTLKNLRTGLLTALELSIKHGEAAENVDHITDVLRQVELTTLLQKEPIYAIAGMQGAGKTTLAKTILGINDEWLDANPGRGEQVPLFIEQVDGDPAYFPQVVYQCLNLKTGEIQQQKGEGGEQLQNLLRDWNSVRRYEKAGFKLLYPKLLISKKSSFIDEQVTWALLPGYELTTSKNYLWQDMMRHVLVNARGVMFVTDASLLANDSKSGVLQDLRDNFSDRGPVVVISKTEMLGLQEIEQLKTSAAERVFPNVGMKKEDIVATGSGNSDIWIDALRQTVTNKLTSSAASEAIALDNFMGLIREDVSEIINDLRILADKQQHHESMVEEILEAFDESAASHEQKLRAAIKKHTRQHFTDALLHCEENYKSEEVGFQNNLKIFARRLSLRGVEVDDERSRRILDAWNKQYENVSIHEHNFKALTSTNTRVLRAQGLLPTVENEQLLPATAPGRMGYLVQDKQTEYSMTDPELMTGLYTLLKKPSKEHQVPLPKKLTAALDILPALMLENARSRLAMQLDPACTTQLAEEIQPKQIFDALFSSSEQYHPIKTAMMAFLGADAADGTVDGKSAPNNEGGLTPLALVGKAALVASVAYGIYQITGVIRDSDKAQIYYIRRAMEELAFHNEQTVIGNYQEMIAELREHIAYNLKQIFGETDALANRSALILAINKLTAAQKEAKLYETHFRKILG
ncbi:hypothetical protein GHT39_06135 [Citrobacter braakii]|uniref:hypothetical protein n=1 Tax=Citrobacter braakii TaxID=57706 RepID=UPI0019073669|nr:hypothetical protein [Citrobacter braakii]MBJ9225244.1 hypothetical protein [Citrobacter braakii]